MDAPLEEKETFSGWVGPPAVAMGTASGSEGQPSAEMANAAASGDLERPPSAGMGMADEVAVPEEVPASDSDA